MSPLTTQRLSADNPEHVKIAGDLLKAGELVAIPTETVYGLAADASNPEAVKKIFAAKNRPADHPLIVHIPTVDHLSRWASTIPSWVSPLADEFWPGPLTMIFDKCEHASDVVTGGLSSVGVRIPSHPVLLELLKEFDIAVAAPSANPYQKLSPTTAEQVLAGLDGKIAAVLDGGSCSVGTESTILKVLEDRAEVLRCGPLSAGQLQPFLDVPVKTLVSHEQAVSGNKKVHYQPNAKVMLVSTEKLKSDLNNLPDGVGLLTYSDSFIVDNPATHINLPSQHQGYRQGLYNALHRLDSGSVRQIWVEQPPNDPSWLDMIDRLSRASA